MSFLFFKKSNDNVTPMIYQHLVQQARLPSLYLASGVADTNQNRFEFMCMHMYLVLNRLKNNKKLGQKLFDLFFKDMDRNIREMGVGDLGVSRKIKEMITYFYDRCEKYDKAKGEFEELMEIFFPDRKTNPAYLNHYMKSQIEHLAQLTDESLAQGYLSWEEFKHAA